MLTRCRPRFPCPGRTIAVAQRSEEDRKGRLPDLRQPSHEHRRRQSEPNLTTSGGARVLRPAFPLDSPAPRRRLAACVLHPVVAAQTHVGGRGLHRYRAAGSLAPAPAARRPTPRRGRHAALLSDRMAVGARLRTERSFAAALFVGRCVRSVPDSSRRDAPPLQRQRRVSRRRVSASLRRSSSSTRTAKPAATDSICYFARWLSHRR